VASTEIFWPAALLEREGELRRISELAEEAAAGHGAVVLVLGEPGIGKSALLAAARQEASARVASLAARGGELERELAFSIVRQLFEPRLTPAEPAVFAGAAQFAAPVFRRARVGTDQAAAGTVVHGLYWLCANLAEQRPLLLTVDDAHWCDEASLRFLSHLSRRIDGLPVLLVLAARPGTPNRPNALDDALRGLRPQTMRLAPLTERAIGSLIHSRFAAPAEQSFCQAVAQATGGNPFLLTEILAAMHVSGSRPTAADARAVEQLRPQSVSHAVLTRLFRLGPDAIEVARSIAVLGPAADVRRLAALAGLVPSAVAASIDALAHEILITSQLPLEFVHPLVRTAVYADTPEAVRAVSHKRVARILAADGVPPTQLVPHLLSSCPQADPWTIAMLRAAADDTLARGAPDTAAACLRRALTEPPDQRTETELLIELGRVLGILNQPAEATQALETALARTCDTAKRAELTLEIARLLAVTGHGLTAARMLGSALPGADRVASDRALWAHADIAAARLIALEPAAGWVAQLEALAAQPHAETEAHRTLLAVLAFALTATGQREGAQVAEMARRAAAGPLPRQMWLAVFAAPVLGMSDEMDEAQDLLDRAVQQAQHTGDVASFAFMSVIRSHLGHFTGRLLEAEADARAAIEAAPGPAQETPLAAAVLIDILTDRGDIEAAQHVAADHGLEGEVPMSTLFATLIHAARGRLRRLQNRPREALVDLRNCGDTLARCGYTNPNMANWGEDAALAHLALGEIDAARERAAGDLALARAFGSPRGIGVALRTSARIEGRGGELDILAEALNLLATSPARLDYARTLVDFGAALRRAGYRLDARQPLRRGLDLARTCGSSALAERAGSELTAAGARPRRAALHGPDALTASELRVAAMARDGCTNREIAQALFVTRRTIEIHLSSAYRKLGITSRADLRTALAKPRS
jgi:DNA-binding CsgD family transcriptional regulator